MVQVQPPATPGGGAAPAPAPAPAAALRERAEIAEARIASLEIAHAAALDAAEAKAASLGAELDQSQAQVAALTEDNGSLRRQHAAWQQWAASFVGPDIFALASSSA